MDWNGGAAALSPGIMNAESDPESGVKGARLLERACDVLEYIASTREGAQRSDIVAHTGMARATVARILAVLVDRGLVHRHSVRRRYVIGFSLADMMQRASVEPDLAGAAGPELSYLRDMTGETAYLGILEGSEVLSIAKCDGAHPIRSAARLGGQKPLHCTSQGKAILSVLPEAEQAALVAGLGFEPLTGRTIVDPMHLLADLGVTKARGFALDDEEIAPGIRCVGAPILTPDGRVLGAISIAGPAWRLPIERLEMLGPELAGCGKRIGAQVRGSVVERGTSDFLDVAPDAPPAFHGLPARWDNNGGVLWHADALGPAVRALAQGVDREVHRADEPLRGIELIPGGILSISESGLCRIVRGTAVTRTFQLEAPDIHRGVLGTACHPDGSLWVAIRSAEGATIATCGEGRRLASRFAVPEGVDAMAWSPDGTELVVAVGRTGTLYSFSAQGGRRRVLARIPTGSGRPAGLAFDATGGLWLALTDGWALARYSQEGEIEQLIPLPVPAPCGLSFGGLGGNKLLIATARHGLRVDSLHAAPLSGRLLALEPGVTGPPPAVLRGWE